jgi:5-methyltetrahydropteroyltriglutamate--homocysteine methyltransferase
VGEIKGIAMTIPTEPIGSIPRPLALIEAVARKGPDDPSLERLYEDAIRDTVERFEATGSPVITDGEHTRARTRCRSTSRKAACP